MPKKHLTRPFTSTSAKGPLDATAQISTSTSLTPAPAPESTPATNDASVAMPTLEPTLAEPAPNEPSAENVLTLRVSGDSWEGDPQIVIKVDGVEVGTAVVTAQHRLGQWQEVMLRGTFSEADAVEISFANDAWGGTATADRNVYVDRVTLDGRSVEAETGINTAGWNAADSAHMYSAGTLTVRLQADAPLVVPTTALELAPATTTSTARCLIRYDAAKLTGGAHDA